MSINMNYSKSSKVPRKKYFGGLVAAMIAPEFASLVGLVILVIVLEVFSGRFFSSGEISGASAITSTIGIIGIGVTILMISGEFDLSVGTTAAFSGIIMAKLITEAGWNSVAALIAGLIAAALIGLINASLTVFLKIPSFIATLGMYFLLGGVNFIITSGYSVDITGHSGVLLSILGGQPRGFPLAAPFIWMILMAIVFATLLGAMTYGNWTFATGSKGGRSAGMVGVPVLRVKIINFIVCSTLSGIAGVMALSQYGSMSSGFSSGYNLIAIVATVLGGTSLLGGRGSVLGTVIGAALLGVLDTGLVLVGAPGTFYTAMIGVILVIAVVLDVRIERLGRVLAISKRGTN